MGKRGSEISCPNTCDVWVWQKIIVLALALCVMDEIMIRLEMFSGFWI